MTPSATLSSLPSALRQAGIDQTGYGSETLRLLELEGRSMFRIHGFPGLRLRDNGSIPLPDPTGHCIGEKPRVLCLRPSEWMVIFDEAPTHDQIDEVMRPDRSGQAACTDISDGLALFRLSGAGAPWLLNKLSGLDFQAGISAGTHCARTRMGHVAVIVHFFETSAGENFFDLIVDRSLARYLWELLCASAPHAGELSREHGEIA